MSGYGRRKGEKLSTILRFLGYIIPYSPWHSFPKWKDKEIRIDSSALKDFSQNDFTKGSIVWLLSSGKKTKHTLVPVAHTIHVENTHKFQTEKWLC